MLFCRSEFCQSIEKAEERCGVLSRARSVGIDRYLIAGKIVHQISDTVEQFDLIFEEIAVLDVILEFFIEMRFDVVCVDGHHLGKSIIELILLFFRGRELC